ncbi:Glutathione S-transferase, C-terminal-like protein [Rhypophila decipiens]
MTTPPAEKSPKPGINIYGGAVVNPYKLTILVEELGIPYNYISVDFAQNEHKSAWFKVINPNGRIPAMVHVKDDATTINLFESGACMLYLVSEFDSSHKVSYPYGSPEYWTQVSWLSWQIAGYGPMMGQSCHFARYFPLAPSAEGGEDKSGDGKFSKGAMEYGTWRYAAEARRLNSVLEEQLSTPGQKYIVPGEKPTIADIAVFIYAYSAAWCGVDINDFPNVKAWIGRLVERPGFQKGLQVPSPYSYSDPQVLDPGMTEAHGPGRKFGSLYIKMCTEEWAAKGQVPALPSDSIHLGEHWSSEVIL